MHPTDPSTTFRLKEAWRLRRLRCGLGFWVTATILIKIAFLGLTIVCLAAPLWVRVPADVPTHYAIFRVAAFPLRYGGIVAAALVVAGIWCFLTAGLRLPHFGRILNAAMIGCLAVAVVETVFAIIERATFKPGFSPTGLPPWLTIVLAVIALPVALIPWLYLALCIDPQQARRLHLLVLLGGFGTALLGVAFAILGLIVEVPQMLAPPGALIVLDEPSRLADLRAFLLRYIDPAFLPIQLAVIWLLVRRLYAAEQSLAATPA